MDAEEIVRRLAACDPMGGGEAPGTCIFCGQFVSSECRELNAELAVIQPHKYRRNILEDSQINLPEKHAADCPWLLAYEHAH